jgi:D-alanyl-D-alanine carboxypeptidase
MKRRMLHVPALAVLVVLLVGCSGAKEAPTTVPELPAPEQPDVGAALQGLLDAQVREQGIPGMAMAVRLADGTVVGRGSGYSDPAGENAWSLDTVSALGSITKSFTAVVIMQLVEEGKLSLDNTIDTWFPDQPNADKITVRMLLSHTSGLANYISGENVMDPKWVHEWAPVDLVAEANRLGPVDEPGSGAHYSNTNYILLGLIVSFSLLSSCRKGVSLIGLPGLTGVGLPLWSVAGWGRQRSPENGAQSKRKLL